LLTLPPFHKIIATAVSAMGIVAGASLAAGAGGSIHAADSTGIKERIREILPPDWKITETEDNTLPRFWIGPREAFYVKIEDTRTVVHHPAGFDYHPFYKIWFCPPGWEGFTQEIILYGKQRQALLLGTGADFMVFYLTLGANTWAGAPEVFRETFRLHWLPISYSVSRAVDPELELKLIQRINLADRYRADQLARRLLGLTMNDRLAYIEFVPLGDWTAIDASTPKKEWNNSSMEVDQETAFIAEQCFLLYPDLDSLYLRRIEGSKFLDVLLSNPYLMTEVGRAFDSGPRKTHQTN